MTFHSLYLLMVFIFHLYKCEWQISKNILRISDLSVKYHKHHARIANQCKCSQFLISMITAIYSFVVEWRIVIMLSPFQFKSSLFPIISKREAILSLILFQHRNKTNKIYTIKILTWRFITLMWQLRCQNFILHGFSREWHKTFASVKKGFNIKFCQVVQKTYSASSYYLH